MKPNDGATLNSVKPAETSTTVTSKIANEDEPIEKDRWKRKGETGRCFCDFFKVFCYRCSRDICKNRCLGIFKRNASNLMPLDGLRAMAILWVFTFHMTCFWADFFNKCMYHGNEGNLIYRVIVNGEQAVDLFFVLSGFLISYIILKELKKFDGKMDYFGFLRGRYLRLIFVMIGAYAIP